MVASSYPESSPRDADVVVVGGGAAGLMAAIQAGERGRRTVLLEKNARLGLKILISGGGRCNLTTTKSGPELEAEYGTRRGRWLRHALRSFPPTALREMIEAEGVRLQEEDLDKIFPTSGRAGDVLQALLRRADAAGVQIVTQRPMRDVVARGEGFEVITDQGALRCARVVLTTGGLSYPKTGSTGDGYRCAQQFGHGMVPTVPHLAPLAVEEPWVRALAGIVLNESSIAVAPVDGKVLCRRQRPILFTHKGLSGPGPMDLAGFVEEQAGPCEVRFDFVPDRHEDALHAELVQAARSSGRREVAHLLPRVLPERLRQALVARAGATGPVAELSKAARRAVVRNLKDCRVPVAGSLGLGHAEVTRGGIPLTEVDPRTMESKLRRGLFLAGEILDVDGPIGGFNFQAAFATARLAGLHA